MSSDVKGGPSFGRAGWKFCLEVASRNGWNSEGTHKREHYGEIDEWSDTFLSNGGQTLTDSDARSLAAALDRAISVLIEVADRARQGGFAIGCANENTASIASWLAARKEAGALIDPRTAEVMRAYGQTLDPYGVDPDLPEEYRQIGRNYFARAPLSDVWVSFEDLPSETCMALWCRLKRTNPAAKS
jgi:hypothetical protein